MQSTPTKKQATNDNAILQYNTPSRAVDPADMRGQMAAVTPEHLKAQLASRPRSVRSAVSMGYSVSPRATLASTRSQLEISSYPFPPSSPAPSHSHSHSQTGASLSPSKGLMPMCDTLPSYPNHSTYSTSSIFERAQKIHDSYLVNWSTSSSSPRSSSDTSPRKRGQMEDEEEDVKEVRNGHMMMGNGMVAPHSDDDDAMEEDGDETMMNGQHTIPALSFGTSSSSCSSSSSTSSFFNTNNININNDPFSSSPFQAPLQQQQARQVKTLPIRKRMPLGKTQSLPVDAFMNSMGRGNSEQAMMGITPDVFNAQDGF